MFLRSSPLIALVLALTGLAGCSGGGNATPFSSINCAQTGQVICLQNCSLSCTSTGCLRTDIAQNETIQLEFSANIDTGSVNTSSIRFRTASGAEPVGEYFVENNIVKFVPTLLVSGNQTFFGFQSGETYTMTLPGGANLPEVVRSTSGAAFGQTLTCTLHSVLGIVDQNGVAPRAKMVVPTLQQVNSAPLDTQIVLEFNELIDITPFLGNVDLPVTIRARRTLIGAGGTRACDPSSTPLDVAGSMSPTFDPGRDITILTFTPSAPLPGNLCIEVGVTDRVTDVSGRSAQPQTFTFLTEEVPQTVESKVEEFDDATMLDAERSAGQWVGGTASFAQIGGDGRHGTLDDSVLQAIQAGTVTGYLEYLGVVTGQRTFRVNTDLTVVPDIYTKTGAPLPVADGRFFFDNLVLPADARLTFTGANPPVLTVTGLCDIQGTIDVSGQSLPATLPNTALGQAGGAGGIYGGGGGKGGDRCPGTSASPAYSGVGGLTGGVPLGHAYASVSVNRGGAGSTLFPATGNSNNVFKLLPITGSGTVIYYSPTAAAGGGGGGLLTPGDQGMVVSNTAGPAAMGPAAAGGNAMTLFPLPPNARSSTHFLIGGSGGGGGTSQALFGLLIGNVTTQLYTPSFVWSAGGGGGGGGGAMALRAGNLLRVGATAKLLANGGSAGTTTLASAPVPCVAGGGSGGSIVLQSASQAQLTGLINVLGGAGGHYLQTHTPSTVEIQGGNGSPGFVRCELPGNPTPGILSTMQPAATASNVGPLTESDDLVSFQSKFYDTGLLFGPEFDHYEIHATVNSQPVVFSDDASLGIPAQAGAAIRAAFQSATLDANGDVVTLRPWRASVRSGTGQTGIASDGLAAFRFQIVVDRTVAANVTIDRLEVVYRY